MAGIVVVSTEVIFASTRTEGGGVSVDKSDTTGTGGRGREASVDPTDTIGMEGGGGGHQQTRQTP